ncbi:MAG: hypothetical protein ABIU54_14775 [Candidatus Eisenbacteria bacterium]
MAPNLKNLLGNGSKEREVADQMRSILYEMQKERSSFEALVEQAKVTTSRLQLLGEPIEKASGDVDAVTGRLSEAEARLEAIAKLALTIETLDERAGRLEQNQREAEASVNQAVTDSQHIRQVLGDLSEKVDLANDLKERLGSFLEVERPFQQLRGDAAAVRTQVEGSGEQMARLLEQHGRMLDAHKLAVSKMEALDRRRDEFSRSLQDKERRISSVEEAVRSVDGVQHTVSDLKRELTTLKALGDTVAQKTAALEAQREAVERALSRADHLDQAMKQVDAGVRQQRENEQSLVALQDHVSTLESLHAAVLERSDEISQLQREAHEQTQATRQELAQARDEMKATVERFDFESRGLESVSQRVADLRAALSEFEQRYKGLAESSHTVGELQSQTTAVATQLANFSEEFTRVDDEVAKLQGMREELVISQRVAGQVLERVARIESAQPAVQAALNDIQGLSGSHVRVKDAHEQMQLTWAEMARAREAQADTRSWLASVEQSVQGLREQAEAVQQLAPSVAGAEAQARRVTESLDIIESRQEFAEGIHQRLAELGAASGQLAGKGQDLQARMDAAEQRFVAFATHAEEADRLAQSIATVTSQLQKAEQTTRQVNKKVSAAESRCESVEAMAQQTQALKAEIDQRQESLAEAHQNLQKASDVRQQAAESAEQLQAQAQLLTSSLAAADQQAAEAQALTTKLEERSNKLRLVEKRLNQFEERLVRWERVDADVKRSLEQIASRQSTVEALQSDLDRMFALVEKTATDVRTITSEHQGIAESRALLADVSQQLNDIRDTTGSLDERKRQMTKAEERLARADALVTNVRSSLEALEGQKAMVDQAIEKAGSLQFLLKQAEATIDSLREERKMDARVRAAVAVVRDEEDEQDDEDVARAA